MKHLLTIILTALLPVVAMSQKSTVNLTITGMDKGVGLVVNELQGDRMAVTDTLSLDAKGNVKLERRSNEPSFLVIAPAGARGPILHLLMMPHEKVTLEASYDETRGYFWLNKVKGSDNMELYRRYNNLQGLALDDEWLRATMPDSMEQLIGRNKELLMSAFLITYFESNFERYAPLYVQVRDALIGQYPQQAFVRHLDQKINAAVLPGMMAPEIVLPDTSGIHQLRLSDLRGKVVLIDFWASWCSPCRMENPNVVRLYKKYHERGFEVFSVSLDKDRDKWINAIAKDGLVWPNHVSDLMGWGSAAGKRYQVSSIPNTVLVDRDGRILARNLRGSELEKKLKELLEQ